MNSSLYWPEHSADSLSIMTWVPRSIKYDNSVSSNKIDSQTPSPGGHEEQLDRHVGIEAIDQPLSFHSTSATIQSVVRLSWDPGLLKIILFYKLIGNWLYKHTHLSLCKFLLLEKLFNEIQCEERLREEKQSVLTS